MSSIWWLIYLGVFPTAIAFTTYAFALNHMSAGSLGVTTYLVPPITIVLGLVFLSEAPPAMAYAGGALALVGVAVARRKPRPKAGLTAGPARRGGAEPGDAGSGSSPDSSQPRNASRLRSARRGDCATPTPCGSRRRNPARGSC